VGQWRHRHIILDLGTRWRLLVSFMLVLLYPRETAPDTHLTGDWVGPRIGLDITERAKILTLPRIEPLQTVACRIASELSRFHNLILALYLKILSASLTIWHRMGINESQRIRKEAFIAYFEILERSKCESQ
jgi:hypothetical protein